MPRPRAPKVTKPPEEPTPPAEASNDIGAGLEPAPTPVDPNAEEVTPPPEYLRIIITLRDGRGSIGLQHFGYDPVLVPVDLSSEDALPEVDLVEVPAHVAQALAQVPAALAQAEARWREWRQNPKYTRPAPPPRAPTPARAARTPARPAAPAGPTQNNLF